MVNSTLDSKLSLAQTKFVSENDPFHYVLIISKVINKLKLIIHIINQWNYSTVGAPCYSSSSGVIEAPVA